MSEPLDKGAARETRAPKPCGKRGINNNNEAAWCQKPDGHDGPCNGVFTLPPSSSDFGPNAAKRRRF